MRIKRNPLSFASSPEFEHIIIIPNTEENVNFILFIKRDEQSLNEKDAFTRIRSTLAVNILINLTY